MKAAHLAIFLFVFVASVSTGQTNNSHPYCQGSYQTGQCNQTGPSNTPGNSINDFINDFYTTGANVNISNLNSGCNGLANNYIYYGCAHYLAVQAGQTITCHIKSGITYAQGFAIWIDWDQDNVFANPGERVAATSVAPTANTWTTLTFVIPATQAPGTYRLRLRCAYAIGGTAITPCSSHSHGETEDYNLFVGTTPSGIITATASSPNPTVCAGTQVSLNVAYSGTTVTPTYTWTGPGNYSSTAQNPVFTSTGQAQSGTYTVVVGTTCPGTSTIDIRVVDFPQYTIGPSAPTICQNGKTYITSTFPPGTNISNYSFLWAPATGQGTIFSKFAPSTSLIPLPLPVTQSVATLHYSITVTPTAHSCPVTKVVTLTINNPFSPTLNLPPPLCNTSQQFQFSSSATGGTWLAVGMSLSGLLTPSLGTIGTNTVQYNAIVSGCPTSNTGTFSISKFHTPALTSSLSPVCEKDAAYNLMNLAQDTVTGLWSGPGVSQNRYFSPAGLATGVYNFTYNTWSTPVSSVCPAFTVISVSVFNPPTPTITSIAPRCNNANTIQLTASPPGGTWNGVAVTVGGLLTPSLATIGTNLVNYTAGQGTCNASSGRTFHVSQFNSASTNSKFLQLCASSKPVSLMTLAQNTIGAWTGPNVSNNVFNPLGLSTATYTLSYRTPSTPDAFLCPDSNVISIHVLNPPTPVISQAGPFCSRDGTVQLNVFPDNGQWISSQALSSTGVFNPKLAPIGLSGAQYIIGTSTCNAQSKINISVEAFVPAALTQDKLQDLCNTSAAVNLQPYSSNNSGSWQGPGMIGSIFSPALSGTGSFKLVYSTSSIPSGLCPDQSTLAVNVFSLAPPNVSAGGPYCSNASPLQLTVSPVGGYFEGVNNRAITNNGLFRPADAQPGLNVVGYSITSGPCLAYAQATVHVERFVSAALHSGAELAFCNNAVAFNLHHLAMNPGHTWSGPAVDANGMFDPSKANIGDNILTYHTKSFPSGTLCPDKSTVKIRVDGKPDVSPVASVYSGCAPLNVQLSVPGTQSGKGEWILGDGTAHVKALDASHTFTAKGSYSVAFNYTSGACYSRTTLKVPVKVLESPRADFEFSRPELLISDPQVDLINKSTVQGNNRYVWDVQGQGNLTDISPGISFPKAGNYRVTLKATSFEGCTDELTRYIEVRNDFHVYVPNSFSPNFDQLNDVFSPVFSPYGLDVKSYSMDIFDRWGHLVYQTNDITRGWNGTYQNKGEQPLKEGSYVYRIRFRDLEGQSYSKSGTVLLLSGN